MLYDTLPELTSQPATYTAEETAQRQNARLARRFAERIESLQASIELADLGDPFADLADLDLCSH